jgi:CBS domain-containing protein
MTTLEELIMSIRERRIDALIDVNEGGRYQNSYGHGYDVGFLAALDEILENYEEIRPDYEEAK